MAPPAGVRSDYQATRVSNIAVAPTFSLDTFGVDKHERRVIERTVDFDAVQWLRRAGFAVNTPETLKASLSEWDDIKDTWYRGVELESLFEAGAPEFQGAEIASIRRLGDLGMAETVLMIQVLYQSESSCRGDAQDFTSYAVMQSVDVTPYPCVMSHLEAKLVDAKTGKVMWHNRAYVELAETPSPTGRRQALRECVEWLLGSSNGLLKMRSAESAP